MKEIKAYIRPEKVDAVVHALEDAGFASLTIIPVDALGALADPKREHLSELYASRCSGVCKLELVCRAEDVDRAIRLIVEIARSGYSGDGIVFVSEVSQAVKIRTGVEGREAIDAAT